MQDFTAAIAALLLIFTFTASSCCSCSLLPLRARYLMLWSRPKCETLRCRKSNDANIWWGQHVIKCYGFLSMLLMKSRAPTGRHCRFGRTREKSADADSESVTTLISAHGRYWTATLVGEIIWFLKMHLLRGFSTGNQCCSRFQSRHLHSLASRNGSPWYLLIAVHAWWINDQKMLSTVRLLKPQTLSLMHIRIRVPIVTSTM